MGLNNTQLEIIIARDDEMLSYAAGVILMVREEGNLLLYTFLLGNAADNTLLGIIIVGITNGAIVF